MNSTEEDYPGGKPNVWWYYTSSHSGGIGCKFSFNHTDLDLIKQDIEYPEFPGYKPMTRATS